MAGRTPRQAVENYLDPIRKSIGCITPAYVTHSKGGRDLVGHQHSLVVNGGDPIMLGGPAGVSAELSQLYEIIPAENTRSPYKVRTLGYMYTIRDHVDREILGYHWHPAEGNILWPHLHLKHGIGARRREVEKAHLPTGRVAIEDFIRLLILSFEVPPHRPDWEEILAGPQERFERW